MQLGGNTFRPIKVTLFLNGTKKKQFGVIFFELTKKKFKKLSISIVNYDTLKCIH